MTDLLRAERIKTADDLINATECYKHWNTQLMICANDKERACAQAAVDHFKAEVIRLGDRLLQFAAAPKVGVA